MKKWGERELIILADVDQDTHGRLSAVKLLEQLEGRGVHLSQFTVRRMLNKITKGCPICAGKNRIHQALPHYDHIVKDGRNISQHHTQQYPEATHISIHPKT